MDRSAQGRKRLDHRLCRVVSVNDHLNVNMAFAHVGGDIGVLDGGVSLLKIEEGVHQWLEARRAGGLQADASNLLDGQVLHGASSSQQVARRSWPSRLRA